MVALATRIQSNIDPVCPQQMGEHWICITCGTQFQQSDKSPSVCPICEDDRQFVGHSGQQWTTRDKMTEDGYRSTIEEQEPGVWSIGIEPKFGIGQRAILLQTGTQTGSYAVEQMQQETGRKLRKQRLDPAVRAAHENELCDMRPRPCPSALQRPGLRARCL